jgi:hypothetical protein
VNTIRIRLAPPRKPAEPNAPPVVPPDAVIQGDYGDWWLGLHDTAAGGFPTMQFAAAVAARSGVAA